MTAQLGCFLAGVLFSSCRFRGYFTRLHASAAAAWVSACGLLAVAALDGYCQWKGVALSRLPLLAIALAGLVFANKFACAFFSNGLSRFLGKISFPLYLMQFPVLVSYTSWLIVGSYRSHILALPMILWIAATTLALCILAAVLFDPVDRFTAWVGRRLTWLISAAPQKMQVRSNPSAETI
jgi:peptidoglycan/LPS O-acetylase OafA/YrhL